MNAKCTHITFGSQKPCRK